MKTVFTSLIICAAFTQAIGQKTELVYKTQWVNPVYNAKHEKVITTDSSIIASFYATDSFRTKGLKLDIPDGFKVTLKYNTKGELLWSNTISNLSGVGFGNASLMNVDVDGNLYYSIYKDLKMQVNGKDEFTSGKKGSVLILDKQGNYVKDIAVGVTGISLGKSTRQQSKYKGTLVQLHDTVSYVYYIAKILPDGSIDTLSKRSHSLANVPFGAPSYFNYTNNELYWLFPVYPGKGDLVVDSDITIKEPIKEHQRMVVLKLNTQGDLELVAESNDVKFFDKRNCFLYAKDDKLLMGITFNANDTFKINSAVISNGKSLVEAALLVLDDKKDIEYMSFIDQEATGDYVANFEMIGVEGNYVNALINSINYIELDGGFKWDDAVANKLGRYHVKIDLTTWKVQDAIRSIVVKGAANLHEITTVSGSTRCYVTHLKANSSVSFDGEFNYSTGENQIMSLVAFADTQTVVLPNSIKNGVQENTFSLYPNPSSGQVQLVFTKALQAQNGLNIYNSQGKLVYSSSIAKGSHQKNLDLSALGKGVYFVQVASAHSISQSRLIVE